MRISVGLALLAVCAVCAAFAIGLLPGTTDARAQLEIRTAELLANQLSIAITSEDGDTVTRLASQLVGNMPDVRSLSVVRDDGAAVLQTLGHEEAASRAERGDGRRIDVPLFQGDRRWGTLQIVFVGATSARHRYADLIALVFVGCSSFMGFVLYMRRTLRILDPSQVVPDRVRAAFDTLSEGAMILDNQRSIVLANRVMADLVGVEPTALLGTNVDRLPWVRDDGDDTPLPWHVSGAQVTRRGLPLKLRGKQGVRALVANAAAISGSGSVRGLLVTIDDVTPIQEKNEELVGMLRQLSDAQRRVELQNQELQRLATRDALTGCLNRRAFHEQLATQFAQAARYGHALSAIMVDVDHFKSINDRHGHARGDEVLRAVGSLLQSTIRSADILCRYGGEEFCVLLPHTSLDEAAGVAEKLRNALVSTPIAELAVTASFGVSSTQLHPDSPQVLVDQADQALYCAKRGGRNRVERFDRIDAAAINLPNAPAESKDELETQIPVAAVVSLLRALAFRHPSTAEHSRRVADLCVHVGSAWMSPRDMFVLEIAALLHDIGKIGVPDSILLKPGPLTKEEWDVMDLHSQIGVEIVESSFRCPELTEIIRTHHARQKRRSDGRSPEVVEEVSLRARLLAVADAYDAMTYDRVYRKGCSHEDAIAELRRCAGTQFDRQVVESFISAFHSRPTTSNAVSDARWLALRLGLEVERLAAAIDRADLPAVKGIAHHLAAVAASLGATRVAELASRVQIAVDGGQDLREIVRSAHQLLEEIVADPRSLRPLAPVPKLDAA